MSKNKINNILHQNFMKFVEEFPMVGTGKISEIIGCKPPYVSALKKGKKFLNDKHIKKLCTKFNLPEAYFLSIENNTLPDTDIVESMEYKILELQNEAKRLRKELIETNEKLAAAENKIIENQKKIPFV